MTTTKEKQYKLTPKLESCDSCGTPYEKSKLTDLRGCHKKVCEDCFGDVQTCTDCGDQTLSNNYRYCSYTGDYYCHDCYIKTRRRCDGCGSLYHRDDDELTYHEGRDRYYCEDCYPHDSEQYLNEHDIPFQTVKSETFKKNKNKEFCGVEIEANNNNLNEKQFKYEELLKWGFSQTSDGSLDEETGVEFYSNAYNGDLLFNKITDFCKELKKRNYTVNSDCGLHIHIGINKRNTNLKKIYFFYKKYEPLFYSMVSPSRTNNTNCYRICSVFNFTDNQLLKTKNNTDIKKLFYETKSLKQIQHETKQKYNGKRYCWINFHSIFLRGTFEIRVHNGTIDHFKIINWFKINLEVLNFLKNLSIDSIRHLPDSEEFFLSIFSDDIKKYVLNRWKRFKKSGSEESD
jgi:hypothetical protein